jgi:hypothetical protein
LERLFDLATAQGIVVPVPGDVLRRLNPYAVALRYESSEVIWMTEEDAAQIVNTLLHWASNPIEASEESLDPVGKDRIE